MTAEQFAAVLAQEISDRISWAVQDLHQFCDKRDEPLTRQQRFAVSSMPLRITLDLDDTITSMVRTYDAIRAVTGRSDWPDDLMAAWLRETPSERSH